MRFFNTAGPVNCGKHYCISPLERLELNDIMSLIEQEKYFILHAPRQTGKTSCILALMDYLNSRGQYKCLYVNVESAQALREDIDGAMRVILNTMSLNASTMLNDDSLDAIWLENFNKSGGGGALGAALTRWCQSSEKPIVLLIDEIDSLIGDTLISVLRQLREGYSKRPKLFPQSMLLCGVRDVKDYRIHSSRDKAIITGGSAFNIKSESLRLGNFSREEVKLLLSQHTTDTGKKFEPETFALFWELTGGQPWLVNALAYETCFRMKEGNVPYQPVNTEMVFTAKENIILRRETHIDQLIDKLREDRVRQVIEPILAGVRTPISIPIDDQHYVQDLGLIRIDKQLEIANPIYKEIIPRELSAMTQTTISEQTEWYQKKDGSLDMVKLLTSFQEFFRENSEHWIQRFDYKEAGPQLLLQAFLQRIVNGGGTIEREYGLGRMRTDLLIIWKYEGGVQKIVIELKILNKSLELTTAQGIEQTVLYLDRVSAEQGYLIIFDRSEEKTWEEKLFVRNVLFKGKSVIIWGM